MIIVRRAKTGIALYLLVFLFFVFAAVYKPSNTESFVVAAKYQNFRMAIIMIAFFASFAFLSDMFAFFSKKISFNGNGISVNGNEHEFEKIARIIIKKEAFSWALEIYYSTDRKEAYRGLIFNKEEIKSIKALVSKRTKFIAPIG